MTHSFSFVPLALSLPREKISLKPEDLTKKGVTIQMKTLDKYIIMVLLVLVLKRDNFLSIFSWLI